MAANGRLPSFFDLFSEKFKRFSIQQGGFFHTKELANRSLAFKLVARAGAAPGERSPVVAGGKPRFRQTPQKKIGSPREKRRLPITGDNWGKRQSAHPVFADDRLLHTKKKIWASPMRDVQIFWLNQTTDFISPQQQVGSERKKQKRRSHR